VINYYLKSALTDSIFCHGFYKTTQKSVPNYFTEQFGVVPNESEMGSVKNDTKPFPHSTKDLIINLR